MAEDTDARDLVASVEGEFRRYKALAEGAMVQLTPDQLSTARLESDNSIATLVWHIAGNLASRFTDFLSSDGEKPWRERDAEFEPRSATRAELTRKWERGWEVLLASLAELTDADLTRTVSIREVPLPAHQALHRALAHVSYHVGQIVYLAKELRGPEWRWLSIPPGGSAAYRDSPAMEKPLDHAAAATRPAS